MRFNHGGKLYEHINNYEHIYKILGELADIYLPLELRGLIKIQVNRC